MPRRPITQSNLSLLGLIRHLAKPDADFEDVDPAQAEADSARLLAEQEMARQAVSGVSLDATFITPDGDEISLRLVFNHMIAEYTRHNGHADLVCQCVNDVTGA